MNTRARFAGLVLVGLLPLSSTGCIVIGVGGWSWGGSAVWTEPVTQQIAIDTVDLKALEVRTHNGSISFDAQPEGMTEAYVTVTKKAGGRTRGDAEAAFEALDVYVEPAGSGTQRIGWRWKGIKRANWGARVSFDIKAPGEIRFEGRTHNGPVEIAGVTGGVRVETHNGRVEVDGVSGDVWLKTHNGPVVVTSAEGTLCGRTHNGRVVATYTGDDITLVTHNGRIVADLSRCGALGGTLTTHNGGVEVVVGEATSAGLTARTHNGGITCDVPLNESRYSRRKLTGRIGAGEGTLDLTTHNGSVRIKKAAG